MQASELGYLQNVHRSILEAFQKVCGAVEVSRFDVAAREANKVVGALQLARFQGVARVAMELVECLKQGESSTLSEQEVKRLVKLGVTQIRQYVLDLLAGAPDVPIKLWGAYKELRESHKAVAHPAHLFFPLINLKRWEADIQQSTNKPKADWKSMEARLVALMKPWIDTPSETKELAILQAELTTFRDGHALSAGYYAFISAAIAALAVAQTRPDPFAVHALSKINTQLQQMNVKIIPDQEVWRFLLYVVAFAPSALKAEEVDFVRQRHDLIEYVAAIKEEAARKGKTLDEVAITPMRERLAIVKDIWSRIIAEEANLQDMLEPLHELNERLKEFQHPAIIKVGEALSQIMRATAQKQMGLSEVLGEEIASLLMLLDQACEAKGRVSSKYDQLAINQIKRTVAAFKGDAAELSAMPTLGVDDESIKRNQKQVKASILQEVKSELQLVEESLDAWFREPLQEHKGEVYANAKPLKRLIPILKISQYEEAANAMQQILLAIEVLLNKTIFLDSDKEQISQKIAALALYLSAEMSEQADAIRFLGGEPDIKGPRAVEEITGVVVETQLDIPEVVVKESLQVNPLKAVPPIQVITPQVPKVPEQKVYSGVDALDESVFEMLESYLEDFEDQLVYMKEGVFALSNDPNNKEALTDVRRGFHTIKGSARMIQGFVVLPNVAEKIELFLKRWLAEEREVSSQLMSAIEEAVNACEGWAEQIKREKRVEIHSDELLKLFDPAYYAEYKKPEVVVPAQVVEVEDVQPAVVEVESESVVTTDDVAESPIDPQMGGSVFVGDILVERESFKLFLQEASESMRCLSQEWEKTTADTHKRVTRHLMSASHKLSSSCRTMRFAALAEVAQLIERWSERRLEGKAWISNVELEAVSSLIKHAQELFEAIEAKEKLMLDMGIIKRVEEFLVGTPKSSDEVAEWAKPVSAIHDEALREKMRQMLEEELKAVRAHLGRLESMLMLLDDGESHV
jgi:chemosensory pili system protein ChpA (sensor histidine kinase/response regulator)